MLTNDGGNGTKIRFQIAALLLVAAGVGVGCGSVSQTGDAGSAGAHGGTDGSAGATAGASGGSAGSTSGSAGSTGGSAGASGSAGAHGGTDGGAGISGSAGAHGGTDGGAGGGGKDGGAAGKDGGGSCVCSAIYSPVCGVDGKTYASSCNAACAGVAVAHSGVCVAASDGGADGSVPLGYCDQSSDCVSRLTGACSCTQTCAAKTDPLPPTPAYACLIACPLIVLDCGCVNHQCTAGASIAATP